jgi:hypothetical protein
VTPSARTVRSAGTEPSQEQVDTLVAASRVFVALSVQSLAEVDEVVTLVQLRALVVLTSQGPANLSTLAEALGVHASNASRTCEALVSMGLLDRRDDPTIGATWCSPRGSVAARSSERCWTVGPTCWPSCSGD